MAWLRKVWASAPTKACRSRREQLSATSASTCLRRRRVHILCLLVLYWQSLCLQDKRQLRHLGGVWVPPARSLPPGDPAVERPNTPALVFGRGGTWPPPHPSSGGRGLPSQALVALFWGRGRFSTGGDKTPHQGGSFASNEACARLCDFVRGCFASTERDRRGDVIRVFFSQRVY